MLVAKSLNCVMRLLWLKVFITSLLLGGAAAIVGVVVLLLFVVSFDVVDLVHLKFKFILTQASVNTNCKYFQVHSTSNQRIW